MCVWLVGVCETLNRIIYNFFFMLSTLVFSGVEFLIFAIKQLIVDPSRPVGPIRLAPYMTDR